MFTRCCTTCSQSLFQKHANYILLGVSRSTNTILKEYNTPRKARCCRHITRIFRIGTQIRVYISSIKTHYKFMTWLNGNERFVFWEMATMLMLLLKQWIPNMVNLDMHVAKNSMLYDKIFWYQYYMIYSDIIMKGPCEIFPYYWIND